MSEATGVGHGLPGSDDLLEWVPAEVQEGVRQLRFRRLTPDERTRLHGREVPAAYLRQKRFQRSDSSRVPTPTVVIATPAEAPTRKPELDGELARRLIEVESIVSRAAEAVDRRAEHVRTLLADAIETRRRKRPN
jgi:hypothetical protein